MCNNIHLFEKNDKIKTNFEKKDLELFKRVSSFQNISKIEHERPNHDLVPVSTTLNNIELLDMAITTDLCIIVEGAISSGKTSLIEHLAIKNFKKLIKYQMDDFMDSKVRK